MENNESEGCEYLLHVIFGNKNQWSIWHKLRAMKCLLSVIGSHNLEEISGIPSDDLDKKFQDLILTSKLEALNLPYHTADAFCDKMPLIETILRSCGHMEQGIALIVDICVQYKIYKPPTLWVKLLSRYVMYI